MSVLGEIFGAIRQVVTLDDRIRRVEDDVSKLQPAVALLSERVTRVETIIEMARYAGRARLD